MVARNEYAVAKEAEVPVGMTGELEGLPTADLAAFVQQLGVDRVADERREGVSLHDQVFSDIRGHAVSHEPGCDSLRPIVASPDPLTLCVVEAALVDGSFCRFRGRRGAADVVGMEVSDCDALDLHRPPRGVSQPETGVEERAVRQVAVDVLGSGRQRQRQPLNIVFELVRTPVLYSLPRTCGSSIAKSPARAPSTR